MIKSLIILLVLAFTVFLAVPVAAQIGTDCSGEFAQTQYCQDQPGNQSATNNDVINILRTITNILTIVVGVVAVFGVIIGGYQMTTGGGNPESVSRGRKTIIYALVGLAITVLARTIIVFVLGRL